MTKIWDLWIRLFHWSLAFLVLFLIISGTTGAGFYDWHRPAGEAVLVLLLFRFLWGLMGSSNVRLHHLVSNPIHALQHLFALFKSQPGQYRGHSPAGAWATLALLLCLSIQAGTGLFIADEDELIEGAFYGTFSSSTRDLLLTIHEWNATVLQVLLCLHVAMIALYFFVGRQNLLLPMITGKAHWRNSAAIPEVHFGKWWAGLVVIILSVLLISVIVGSPLPL